MSQPPIQIITDSTCDIPQSLVEQYQIQVISHYVIWGNEQYRDRVTITPETFYQRLETDPVHPTSAQATEEDFLSAYDNAATRGAKEMIVVTVSSAMSGAYQMALNAAKRIKIPIHVVDARGPTMSVGWQVLAAARACAEGADVASILSRVSAVRDRLVQLVCMDTMDYLQQGGRLGGAVKWVGAKLSIKPLVSINHQTGLVEPVGIARTHKNVVELMYRKFFEQMTKGKNMHVAVLHGNILAEAEALAARIQAEFQPAEILVNITGPVLGINTGPRALALCGYTE